MLPLNRSKDTFVATCSVLTSRLLKGIGQIMLQENPYTGLLFLVGIFYGSIFMGLGALVATVCGTATATFFRYGKKETDSGLYGFSAALVGVAIMLFLKPTLFSWVLVCVGSVLASMLQHFFLQRSIPVFTLPFVVVTWLLIVVAKYVSPALFIVSEDAVLTPLDGLAFAITGFGQVIFQGGILSGILFFIAVYISAPNAALIGLAAAVFSGVIAQLFQMPIGGIEEGLWSYNAVLCAIALAGSQVRDGVWVLLAILLSIVVQIVMVRYNIIPLTFPFVAATCAVLFLKNRMTAQ